MSRDFDLTFDPELERRLHDIAAGVEPELPARVRRFAADVATGRTAPAGGAELVMERVKRPALIPRPGRTALALAAAIVVLAVGAAGLVALRPYGSPTPAGPSGPAQWTGLSWRDVTATAFPAVYVSGDAVMSVVYWHGNYYANPATLLWSSPDGFTWHQVDGAPGAFDVVVANDRLFVVDGSCTPVSYTTDGRTWQTADLPGDCLRVSSIAATPSTVVVVVPQKVEGSVLAADTIYRSTDGATWTRAELTSDMATAEGVGVSAGRAGFLARGSVPDPSSIQVTGQNSYWTASLGAWYSLDGSSWLPASSLSGDIGPTGSFLTQLVVGPQLERGAVADWLNADGRGYHSVDDVNWIPDTKPIAIVPDSFKVSSDGTRVLAQTSGPAFHVSLGDGTWRQLENAGNFDTLSDGGGSWVLADGVLYVADGHVFFGTPLEG